MSHIRDTGDCNAYSHDMCCCITYACVLVTQLNVCLALFRVLRPRNVLHPLVRMHTPAIITFGDEGKIL